MMIEEMRTLKVLVLPVERAKYEGDYSFKNMS